MKVFFQFTASLIVTTTLFLGGLVAVLPGVQAKSEPNSPVSIERYIIKTHVYADGSDVETREITKLIRSQIAIDTAAQADISFNSTLQKVEVLEAYTTSSSGQKIPVASNAIREVDDDISGGAQQFSDQKHRIIIFPNVTPGARVTYKVKITSHTPLFAKNYQKGVYFSPSLEIQQFEWHFSHDPRLMIKVDAKKIPGGRQADGPNGEKQYKFHYQHLRTIPKINGEVDYADHSPHLIFSSFKSPLEIGKYYENSIQSKLVVTKKVTELAQKITKGIDDPQSQAIALYQWVSLNIRYVAIFLGDGGIVPNDADTIIDRRYGDCKDHDLLLRALLLAKDIPSSSALINSESSYRVGKLGTIYPFNHVITYLPKWEQFVDSTLEIAPYGVLDFAEMDKPVVLTAIGKMGRTPKPSDQNNGFVSKAYFQVDERGGIYGTSLINYMGSEEFEARSNFYTFRRSDDNLEEKKYLSSYRQTGNGSFRPSNSRDLNTPFSLESKFYLDPIVNLPGPGAMTVPIGLSSGFLADIPFKEIADAYHFPYRCFSGTFLEISEIHFPKKVKVIKLPTGADYAEYGALYVSTYTLEDNVVTVSRILKLNQKSAVCPAGPNKRAKRIRQVVRRDMLAQIMYE